MKRTAIAALLLLAAAGWCAAQSDSAAPAADSARVRVQVEQRNDTTAAVTVTTEQGKSDSATTVTLRSGREGRETRRERRRRDWVLGCRMTNLEFKNFPGTVTIQRRLGRFVTAGLGLEYTSDKEGPSELRSRQDSSSSDEQSKSWSLTMSPEVALVGRRGPWQGSVGLRYGYTKSRSERSSQSSSDYGTFSYSTRMNETSTYSRVNLDVPVAVEHLFAAGSFRFSIGLAGVILSAMSDQTIRESTTVETNTSIWSGTRTTIITSDYTNKTPMSFQLRAPFQGTTSIQLKYYF